MFQLRSDLTQHPNLQILSALSLCWCLQANAQETQFPALKGKYVDEKLPTVDALIFAKGVISTDSYEHSAPAFSPDGKTVIWGVVERDKPSYLLEMKKVKGIWTRPRAVSFSAVASDDMYPSFSADGKRLFFESRRPLPSGAPVNDIRLWVVDRTAAGWGIPSVLDTAVFKGFEYAHSLTKSGTIYFSTRTMEDGKPAWNIWYSKLQNNKFQRPQKLGAAINDGSYVDGPYVAKDESYLIFESNRAGGAGENDLYICFKQKDGTWGDPKNMGPKVNTGFSERFAGLTPDGKYFFFSSNRSGGFPDIYWVDAGVVGEMK